MELRTLMGQVPIPQMMHESHYGSNKNAVKTEQKKSEKNVSSPTMSTTNPTWTAVGANSDFIDENQVAVHSHRLLQV